MKYFCYVLILSLFIFEIFFVKLNPVFTMISLDVGQGDSNLILTPDKKIILIDTGPPNQASLDELARFFPLGQNRIDLLIISHFDKDHIGSLNRILNNYEVKEIAYNPFDPDFNETWDGRFLNTSKISPFFGQISNVGCCVKIEWLRPIKNIKEIDSNSSSIALKLSYGAIDIFFGGDSTINDEESISGSLGHIEILKVSHHGSKTSTSKSFVDVLKPKFAIISVGKNSYGHPNVEVIDRLIKAETEVFRTDQTGSQVFIIDNSEKIKTYSSLKCKYFCSYILTFKQIID